MCASLNRRNRHIFYARIKYKVVCSCAFMHYMKVAAENYNIVPELIAKSKTFFPESNLTFKQGCFSHVMS